MSDGQQPTNVSRRSVLRGTGATIAASGLAGATASQATARTAGSVPTAGPAPTADLAPAYRDPAAVARTVETHGSRLLESLSSGGYLEHDSANALELEDVDHAADGRGYRLLESPDGGIDGLVTRVRHGGATTTVAVRPDENAAVADVVTGQDQGQILREGPEGVVRAVDSEDVSYECGWSCDRSNCNCVIWIFGEECSGTEQNMIMVYIDGDFQYSVCDPQDTSYALGFDTCQEHCTDCCNSDGGCDNEWLSPWTC